MALILVIGIPGAGKTTLAHQISSVCASNSKNKCVFSLDDALNAIEWSAKARISRKSWEDQVKREIQERLSKSLESIFVIDDIFYLASMRRPYEKFARRIGLSFFVVYLNTPLEEAIRRNSLRVQVYLYFFNRVLRCTRWN